MECELVRGDGASTKTQPELTEFDELLDGLGGLTRGELAELVTSRIPAHDVPSFVTLASGLSIDALRFVSARTLLQKTTRNGWVLG